MVLYFAVTKDGDYVYLHERNASNIDKNEVRLIDMISDPFALETELNWKNLDEKQKPKYVGMYCAIVKYIQTAEDDYRLDVTSCSRLYTLDEAPIIS